MPASTAVRLSARSPIRILACLAWCLVTASLGQTPPPFSPAKFDPSDVYFQGYLASRSAERLEGSGDYIRAAEQYHKADELFSTIRQYYPDWKPDMVGRRARKTTDALAEVRAKADRQLEEKRNVVAELEGGVRTGAEPVDATTEPPGILEIDPIASRRLNEAEQEVKRLRRLIATQRAEADSLRQQAQESGQQAAEQQRQLDAEEKARLEAEIRKLRRTAVMERTKAEAEIERLRKITDQTTREAEQKVRQFKDLADSSRTKMEAELERLKQLQGQERREAEAEIERLRAQTAEATAGAREAALKLQELNRNNDDQSQQQLARLQQIAEEARIAAEQKQLELDRNSSRDRSRIGDLKRREQLLMSKLKAAEATANSLRARLAAAPVQGEVESLNRKIQQLEQEHQAMSLSLRQSRSGFTQAMDRIATLESELKEARQQATDMQRDLDIERQASNAVVAGQRRQIEALEDQLNEKSELLSQANLEISKLRRELSESQDAFSQLREERDALLLERDQMKALLNLNEAGRIQDLIDQNMALAKNLREANEKLDRMYRESNADKDAVTEALRDLAIAKSQINRLHKEKLDQDKRLAEMEQRLKLEQDALASGQASADPAEVAMLRDIIQRQLRTQQRRRQARELLVDAVKDLSVQDERLADAVELFEAQEMILSPEEQKLIADRQVDGEFVSPFTRSRESVRNATTSLNQDIAVFDRTAKKSFLAGRLLPTRELYEMILEKHPGHVPTLCKVGIVHLKLDETTAAADSFRRAIELDNHNPYALRMLAYSLMRSGQLEEAAPAAREAVELAPNDAKAQILLATLSFQIGNEEDAIAHFKGAINADPLLSEPYYNLALIYSMSGRRDLAEKFYRQALERGALPDAELEKSLESE